MKQLALGVGLRTAAVFKNFYVGPNSETLAAVRHGGANPLWIWGAAATGKTHLLQAACADGAAPSAYFALSQDPAVPPGALEGFERVALLCIDDLELVAGRIEWERMLFKLWNAAIESRARLLFAARYAPMGIDWALPDWASRAASSTVYQLRVLDDAERIEALRMRAGICA